MPSVRKMPETLNPLPFQPTIWNWIKDKPRCAVFAGMGMTKTVCTLTAVSDLILEGAAKGVLVICPHRVGTLAWEAQVKRWAHVNWLTVANMRTPEGQQAWEDGSADVYWINSERLPDITRTVKGKETVYPGFVSRFIKKRKKIPVDILVWDEISQAKNPSSKRANALRPYLHDIPGKFRSPFRRLIGLTGTPHPNSYADLFAPIRLLDPSVFGLSFHQWRNRHFTSDFMGWKWEIKPGAKEIIDAQIADIALVMRSEDHLDLPDCTTIDVDVILPPKVMKDYRTLEKDLLLELAEGDVEALSAAALATKLLQATAGCLYLSDSDGVAVLHDAKIKALRKIRKTHKDEPILVVTHYIHERKRLLEEFPEAVEFHENDVPAWQRGEIPMWIAQSKQISHGIDGLQDSGRIIVWVTPTYSWETYIQLVHRLVRPGQKHETIIYRLLGVSTIDWAVVAALEEKCDGERGLMAAVHALQQLRA